MNIDIYTVEPKIVNLKDILHNILELSHRNGLKYDDMVRQHFEKSPEQYKIPTTSGEMFTVGLFKHPEIAVAITSVKENTHIEGHIHDEVEIIRTLDGEIIFSFSSGKNHTLKKGEIIIIPSNTIHSAYFPIETKFLCLTIPSSEVWPEQKRGQGDERN